MSSLFHPLRVSRIDTNTPDARIVAFEVPDALRETFAFTPGQYLTVRQTVGGADLRRSYSICSGADDGDLRIGVRRVPGGVFSGWMHEGLRVGDTVPVMAPQGRFSPPVAPHIRRHHVGIAGGSGITPILSILRTVLAREPLSRFTLLYANRTLQSTMFREELEDLKNRYMGRLALHLVFSREETEVPLHSGRLDADKLGQFLEGPLPARDIDRAYICGPFAMNDAAEAALRVAGVSADRIHIERFGVATDAAATAQVSPAAAHEGDAEQARIVVLRDGLRREIDFRRDQPSILDSATAAGLEMPFSCTSGVCGTCRCKVLDGAVRMERNFALQPAEVAAGFVLACQAHPLTPRVVLSFDER